MSHDRLDTDLEERLEREDVMGTPYPSGVQTGEQRLRWNWSLLIAATIAHQHDPDPTSRLRFTRQAADTYYRTPELIIDDPARHGFAGSVARAREEGILAR